MTVSAAAVLTRGLWRVPDGASLEVHSYLQFQGALVDFAAALGAGNLFPQWSVFARNGFGSPYLGYYQPGFNYLASPCLWLTGDPNSAIALACTLLALAGALGMFLLTRQFLAGQILSGAAQNFAPFMAATLFLCHPYISINLFRRGDFSEYACAMIMPLALYLAFRQKRAGKSFGPGMIAASTCLAFCVLLHPLLSYPVFIVLALTSRRLWATLFAATMLSAFYWLPLLTELKFVHIDRAFNPVFRPDNHMLHPGHVFFLAPDAEAPFKYDPNYMLVALAALGLASILITGNPVRRTCAAAAAATAGLVFMMTKPSLFLWEWFPLLEKLQFPWRLQNFAAITTAILATCGMVALALVWFAKSGAGRRPTTRSLVLVQAVTLGIAIAAAWPLHRIVPGIQQVKTPQRPADLIESGFIADPFDEWLPKTASTRNPPRGAPADVTGPCAAGSVQREPGLLRMPVTWQPDADRHCEIIGPQYFYPVGWRAEVITGEDRSTVPINNIQGYQMVRLSPSPGGSTPPQVLEFHSEMSPNRKAGVILSGLTALVLAGIALRRSWIKQV
jgi:hypothetical protein